MVDVEEPDVQTQEAPEANAQEAVVAEEAPQEAPEPATPAPKKRGRPLGSKNKPKVVVVRTNPKASPNIETRVLAIVWLARRFSCKGLEMDW